MIRTDPAPRFGIGRSTISKGPFGRETCTTRIVAMISPISFCLSGSPEEKFDPPARALCFLSFHPTGPASAAHAIDADQPLLCQSVRLSPQTITAEIPLRFYTRQDKCAAAAICAAIQCIFARLTLAWHSGPAMMRLWNTCWRTAPRRSSSIATRDLPWPAFPVAVRKLPPLLPERGWSALSVAERGGDSGQLVGLHVAARCRNFSFEDRGKLRRKGGAGNEAGEDDRPMQGTVDYPPRFVPAWNPLRNFRRPPMYPRTTARSSRKL
jgi:hypothetical protein